MTDALAPSPSGSSSSRSMPLLLVLFLASGMAALIYEVVWFQLLQLAIGSTAVSLGVVLATYMGGLCIGSLLLPKYVSSSEHPLRIYGKIEIGIGAIGIVALFVIPLVGYVYSWTGAHGGVGIMLRAIVCVICLLPPTILMGATLPAAARWIESTPRGVSWLGFLYGANTAGAVVGSLLAGFYLIRVFDVTVATFVAATINFAIAAVSFAIAKRTPGGIGAQDSTSVKEALAAPGAWAVYVAIALSGLTALGTEVVWTRLLSLSLGGSTYTFSIILGVFLTGLAFGSWFGSWLARIVRNPRAALGWVQAAQALGITWAAFMVGSVLPFWPLTPSMAPSQWFNLHIDLTKSLWVVLPGAMLWGASFPLALSSVVRPGEDAGKLVGRVYAANTVGAIIGALVFSLIMIPFFGTHPSERVLIVLVTISALVMFAVLLPSLRKFSIVSSVAVVAMSALLIAKVPNIPPLLVAFGRYMVTWMNQVDVLFTGEGINSSIAVTRMLNSGATQFHVAGKVQASNLPQDMRLQRMLTHLPALIHPNPKSVLIVGFGAGITAGTFVPYPNVEKITICEIEPLVPKTSTQYFRTENFNVFNDPRTHMQYDDARNYIFTTKEKFDIITSDPLDPWVKGAATLYTKEHFENIKKRLNPGGIVSQFVQLYESNLEAVKSEIVTFLEVFPNGTVWANNIDGRGYDLVLLGGIDPTRIDIAAVAARLNRPDFANVAASMVEVGFHSPMDLMMTYAANKSDLSPWFSDAQINRDRNLRLQFLAGLGLNQYESAGIYSDMARYRKFPDGLFVADSAWMRQARIAMAAESQGGFR